METLNNYITERIRVDNIKSVKFPIDGKIDDMVGFLQSQGFSQIQTDALNLRSGFNKAKGKCFMVYNTHVIWFADTSNNKINNDNNIFTVDDSSKLSRGYRSYFIWDDKKIGEVNKKTFLEKLNKQFGF